MNSEIKTLWVDALRSGEYSQGRGSLHPSQNTFCCLGVLCELAVAAGVIDEAVQRIGVYSYGDGDNSSDSCLPQEVQSWANLDRGDPMPDRPNIRESLALLNDDGMPFTEIADIIEQYL